MFVYTKTSKPISLRLPACEYHNYKVEAQGNSFFIYDLLNEHEGTLIVLNYCRGSLRFERIESSVELQLVSDDSSVLDYYELAQAN